MSGSRYGLAVVLLASVLAAPVSLDAQPVKIARVGLLLPSEDFTTTFLPGFRQGLRELGYVEDEPSLWSCAPRTDEPTGSPASQKSW